MIIASGKMSGKRLEAYIVNQLEKNGVASVVALSTMGVNKISNAGQRVANVTGRKVVADPKPYEHTKEDGTVVQAMEVQFSWEQ